jgi:hypothetical protein
MALPSPLEPHSCFAVPVEDLVKSRNISQRWGTRLHSLQAAYWCMQALQTLRKPFVPPKGLLPFLLTQHIIPLLIAEPPWSCYAGRKAILGQLGLNSFNVLQG